MRARLLAILLIAVLWLREDMSKPNCGANLVAEGDSLTVGFGATTTYPDQLLALYTKCEIGIFANEAHIGDQLADIATQAAVEIDPKLRADRPNILMLWAGTNDWANAPLVDGATSYATLKTYVAARRAAGWRVIVFTALPRNSGTPGFDTNRQAFNALVVANWRTFADGLADVAADSTIGVAGAPNNATYYSDGIHLTNAGLSIVANIVKPAVDALL